MKSRSKFLLLIGISIALLLFSYFGAVSKTLSIRSKYLKLKKETVSYSDMAQQLNVLASKEVHYDSLVQKMNLSNTSLENNLLKTLNNEIGNTAVKLKAFNAPHSYSNGTSSYTTISFSLEGGFIPILKVLYNLEHAAAFGQILHLEFTKETDYRTRRTALNAQVLLQYIQ